ncbi:MAG: type I-C CRISPR-associated endonuclease Cas1c [Candidatus Omnitrophica bacterium]|nr:type I-C CRISPR-associated endonuclease Cas1c [Candidatus Omnitrophota bacterium]
MKRHLNTLFVTSQGSYLRKEGETLVIKTQDKKKHCFPLHTIESIVCFGNVLCSPYLLGFCSENNVSVSFLTEYGRFLARVSGPVSGNVLLRRQQYRLADQKDQTVKIAKWVVFGKLTNSRIVINRSIRDHAQGEAKEQLRKISNRIKQSVDKLGRENNLDVIRGVEGEAAKDYFSIFSQMIVSQKEDFIFNARSRRPPLDNVNALLSFIYMLLMHDVRSALETVGLDPAVGFLHRDRPGRYGLALDLMEEFRPFFADRLVLSLINLKQVNKKGFKQSESGSVLMDDDTRKQVLVSYQTRKQDELLHPFLEEKVTIGRLFHLQALLMARFIRGDIEGYPPFIWR